MAPWYAGTAKKPAKIISLLVLARGTKPVDCGSTSGTQVKRGKEKEEENKNTTIFIIFFFLYIRSCETQLQRIWVMMIPSKSQHLSRMFPQPPFSLRSMSPSPSHFLSLSLPPTSVSLALLLFFPFFSSSHLIILQLSLSVHFLTPSTSTATPPAPTRYFHNPPGLRRNAVCN